MSVQELEEKGRSVVRDLLSKNQRVSEYHFTTSLYDREDFWYIMDGIRYDGEIKYRSSKYPFQSPFIQQGIMLEKSKKTALFQAPGSPVYVMLFPDRVGIFYDLSRIDFTGIQEKDLYCPTTTYNSSDRRRFKASYILPIEAGELFNF